MTDYYEFLQISPNADIDTIHRVYRFLATRLHPDNPTGDPEKFKVLQAAYDVLSDRSRRAEYDMKRKAHAAQPLSESVDFMDSLEGETNRRLGLLAILYHRRRTNAAKPEVTLNEIEERMGFPRDYLDFTLWYVRQKGYVVKTDAAQFTLTADGVDFVEQHRVAMPSLNRMLLTSGSTPDGPDATGRIIVSCRYGFSRRDGSGCRPPQVPTRPPCRCARYASV